MRSLVETKPFQRADYSCVKSGCLYLAGIEFLRDRRTTGEGEENTRNTSTRKHVPDIDRESASISVYGKSSSFAVYSDTPSSALREADLVVGTKRSAREASLLFVFQLSRAETLEVCEHPIGRARRRGGGRRRRRRMIYLLRMQCNNIPQQPEIAVDDSRASPAHPPRSSRRRIYKRARRVEGST